MGLESWRISNIASNKEFAPYMGLESVMMGSGSLLGGFAPYMGLERSFNILFKS